MEQTQETRVTIPFLIELQGSEPFAGLASFEGRARLGAREACLSHLMLTLDLRSGAGMLLVPVKNYRKEKREPRGACEKDNAGKQ